MIIPHFTDQMQGRNKFIDATANDRIMHAFGERNLSACKLGPDRGGREVVEQHLLRPVEQIDIADDAAGAEFVLVLQVGAVAPLEFQNGQVVTAIA